MPCGVKHQFDQERFSKMPDIETRDEIAGAFESLQSHLVRKLPSGETMR